jgi:hypothetical protein
VTTICDDVRAGAAAIAGRARSVTIDLDAIDRIEPGPEPALDPELHFLDGSSEETARYLLTLDAINFGSGWFPTLRKRELRGRPLSGYFIVASALTDQFRAHGSWSNVELRAMTATTLAEVLGQSPDHELMALYAQALRALGAWLGERTALEAVAEAGGSAQRLAALLAHGMALFDDRGFYKRAQIVPADLALAGVAAFHDLDRLTIFADNVVPHVLRCDGVLVYDERLAAHIDAGRLLRPGPQERELRACAVHACALIAQRLGVPEHTLDNWLWNRGQAPAYKARPRHRCRTVYY